MCQENQKRGCEEGEFGKGNGWEGGSALFEEVGSSLARSQSDYLWFLLAAFEQTRNASAAGRNLAGLETGTVSAKLLINSIRLSLTIGSLEGLRNSLCWKRILPGGHGS